MKLRRAGILIAAGLAAAGAAARLGGAWCYRYGENPDYGIVALMAKHMAEGSDFPVFFYGQAYMGSLEPAVSALMCRILGFSGLAVCLGTALVGILLLPVVYLWARDAGGRIAATAALAYAALGPEGYFHYQSSPRGGYAVTLLLGSLIVWLSCRLAVREKVDPPRAGELAERIFLLGLLAGLGFWSHMLILAAILTAGAVLLAGLKRRAFSLPVWAGVPGFLLGSLPFWLWNARHGWRSFDMASSFGESSPGIERGLKLFWGPRLLGMLDLQDAAPAWRFVILGLHLGLASVAIVFILRELAPAASRLFRRFRRGRFARFVSSDVEFPAASGGDARLHGESGNRGFRTAWIYPGAAMVFILISSVLFSLSTFAIYNSPRYLLPLVPAFAVTAGYATACLWKRLPRPAACVPLAILVGWQMRTLPNHIMREARYAEQRRDALELGDFMAAHGVEHVLTPYILHGLNYLLEERFDFADIQRERCAPLAESVEFAGSVAAMNNCGGMAEFLDAAGGSASYTRFGKLRLHYDIVAPESGLMEIPSERLELVATSGGEDVIGAVSDADLDTAATVATELGQADSLRVVFREPQTVTSIRLLSREAAYPALWEVQARLVPGGPWETLKGPMKSTRYFWSGPRPYWDGRHMRMDCRFAPAKVCEIRLRLQSHPSLGRTQLSELRFFEPGKVATADAADFAKLAALLKSRGISRLYADRGEANRLHVLTEGAVWTSREPEIFGGAGNGIESEWVRFGPRTALLAEEGAAVRTRLCLRKRNVRMRETPLGPWALFDFGTELWREEYRDTPGILFRGFSCGLGYGKYWSAELMKRADRVFAVEGGGSAAGIVLLERAVEAVDDYVPAMEKLARHLAAAGQAEQAAIWKAAIEKAKPEVPVEVRFEKDIHFAGVSVDHSEASPGDTIGIDYFWRCPPDVDTGTIAVFVHFEGPEGRFQDDHELLSRADTRVQPVPEIFVEHREVAIPEDAGAGEYTMRLGLYDRRFPRGRFNLRTSLPNRRRAVDLPVRLIVAQ